MPTKTELHELDIQKAVERALSRIVAEGGGNGSVLSVARDGSGLEEAVDSGAYNSSDAYLAYEVIGDIIGANVLAP